MIRLHVKSNYKRDVLIVSFHSCAKMIFLLLLLVLASASSSPSSDQSMQSRTHPAVKYPSLYQLLCRNMLGLGPSIPGPHWVLGGPSAWPGKNPSPKRVGSFSLRHNYPRHSSQSKVDEQPLKKLYLLGGTRFG